MVEVITLGSIIGVIGTILMALANTVFETIKHFGFLPLALFLAGLLYIDSGNVVGTLVSLGSNAFFGLIVTSSTLFMFMVATIIVWLFVKTKSYIGVQA